MDSAIDLFVLWVVATLHGWWGLALRRVGLCEYWCGGGRELRAWYGRGERRASTVLPVELRTTLGLRASLEGNTLCLEEVRCTVGRCVVDVGDGAAGRSTYEAVCEWKSRCKRCEACCVRSEDCSRQGACAELANVGTVGSATGGDAGYKSVKDRRKMGRV